MPCHAFVRPSRIRRLKEITALPLACRPRYAALAVSVGGTSVPHSSLPGERDVKRLLKSRIFIIGFCATTLVIYHRVKVARLGLLLLSRSCC